MSEEKDNNVKYCRHCDTTKPVAEFGKQSNTKDGLRGWCKDCFKVYGREWRKKQNAKLYWNNPKYKPNRDRWEDVE